MSKFQDEQAMPTARSDANWASDAADRRSISGGVLMHGSRYIKGWNKTQSLVASSSAESELYVLVKASAEAVGIQSVSRDLGQSWSTDVYSDASPALGVIPSRGPWRDSDTWTAISCSCRACPRGMWCNIRECQGATILRMSSPRASMPNS